MSSETEKSIPIAETTTSIPAMQKPPTVLNDPTAGPQSNAGSLSAEEIVQPSAADSALEIDSVCSIQSADTNTTSDDHTPTELITPQEVVLVGLVNELSSIPTESPEFPVKSEKTRIESDVLPVESAELPDESTELPTEASLSKPDATAEAAAIPEEDMEDGELSDDDLQDDTPGTSTTGELNLWVG